MITSAPFDAEEKRLYFEIPQNGDTSYHQKKRTEICRKRSMNQKKSVIFVHLFCIKILCYFLAEWDMKAQGSDDIDSDW